MYVLESKPEAVGKLEKFVCKIVEEYQLDQSLYGDILLSLTEAVNNAIVHGNREDQKKLVKINIKKKNNELHIFVKDQGTGFDPDCIKDPTNLSNIENCGGRGVFLIKKLCRSVYFHNNGATVQMCFEL